MGTVKMALAATEATTAGSEVLSRCRALFVPMPMPILVKRDVCLRSKRRRTQTTPTTIAMIATFKSPMRTKTAINEMMETSPWSMNDLPM